MSLLHLQPDFVDERMTAYDFVLACEWVDSYYKAKRAEL